MIIVIIGISFVVIINEVLIVFCHFPVFYDRKIKMEKKERKSVKKVMQSEFSIGRLKRRTRELFLMTMQQIKVSLYQVVVTSL